MLQFVGTLDALSVSKDVLQADQPGVDYIKKVLNDAINVENDDEGIYIIHHRALKGK